MHQATVQKSASIKEFVSSVAVALDLNPKDCLLIELWTSGDLNPKRVHKFFEDTNGVNSISSGDRILMYELENAQAFKIPSEQRWGCSSSQGAPAVGAESDSETWGWCAQDLSLRPLELLRIEDVQVL